MAREFWNRKFRFVAGIPNGEGFEIADVDSTTEIPMHINFSVERTDGTALNTTKISLWNLSEKHIKILLQDKCRIQLYAGYEGKMPLIFKGDIIQVQTELDGGNRRTDIEAVDAFGKFQEAYISVSYSVKVSSRTIVTDVCKKIGIDVAYSPFALKWMAENAFFENGYSNIAPAIDIIKDACNNAKCLYTIQNGILLITTKFDSVKRVAQAYVLNAETGLLGLPKRIYNSSVSMTPEDSSNIQASMWGYEVTFLMNSVLAINDIIRVESKAREEANGQYRIFKIRINGDNYSGSWQCVAEIIRANYSEADADSAWLDLNNNLGWWQG